MKKFLFVFFLFIFASLQAQEAGKIRYTTRVQWDDSTGAHHIYDCHDVIEGDYDYLLYRRVNDKTKEIVFFDIDKRNCYMFTVSKLR